MVRFRLLLCLLVTVAAVGADIVASTSHGAHAPSVLADEDKDESGNGDDEKDEERDKDDDKDKDNDDGKGRVTSAAGYRVEVDCTYDAGAETTTCTFTGVAPHGEKDVSHVDLPASEVCADVLGGEHVGGEHEFVDPDPNTRVVGYKSRGSKGIFTLVLDGRAAPAGQATYWFKTGDGVFPATGPGLRCGAAATQQPVNVTVEDEDTGKPAAVTTGTVLIWTYSCPVTAPPPAEYDWYGACERGLTPVRFNLAVWESNQLVTVGERAADDEGQARFDVLDPGDYHLEAVDAHWCHAESDHVDEQGDLIVTGGAVVNVWIFYCGEDEAT